MGDQACCPLLDTLAPVAELIDLVFSFIDSVSTLSSFFTTCRFIHNHFEARKAVIISRVLENELGPALVDATLLSTLPYQTVGVLQTRLPYWDNLHDAAETYTAMLRGHGEAKKTRTRALDQTQLTSICRTFHRVNYLTDLYLNTQLRSFAAQGSDPAASAPPSLVERRRVLRALYRRQIINNAWAPTERVNDTSWLDQDMAVLSNPVERDSNSDEGHLRPGLMATFEPWEMQQIDHLNCFVRSLCAALWLAAEARETVTGRACVSEAELGDMLSRIERLVDFMQADHDLVESSLGLMSTLPPCLTRSGYGDPPKYVTLLQRYSPPCFSYGWQHWLSTEDRSTGTAAAPGDEEDGERVQRPGRIDFAGEGVDLVPFGWTDALDGQIVNWYGQALHSFPEWMVIAQEHLAGAQEAQRKAVLIRFDQLSLWRDAGFALWDRKRVEAMKTLDRLRVIRTGWVLQVVVVPPSPTPG